MIVSDNPKREETPNDLLGQSQEIHYLDRIGAARCPQHVPGTVLNPIAFDQLAQSRDELWIELEGQLYHLRKTKQGKLILTK